MCSTVGRGVEHGVHIRDCSPSMRVRHVAYAAEMYSLPPSQPPNL